MATRTTEARIGFYLLEIEFDTPSNGVAVDDLATVLTSIESVVAVIYEHGVGAQGPNLYVFDDGKFRTVRVVGLSMASPLRLLARIPELPEHLMKALARFFMQMVFYEEERTLRQAVAAEAWEKAFE